MHFKSLLLSSLLIITACTTVPLTGRRQINLVSDSEIMALSDQSFQTYMAGAKRSGNTQNTRMVERCGKKIQLAVETYLASVGASNLTQGYNWEFILSEDATPNAFCLPGGKVVIYDGILPYTATEDGLAVVIGHEIAHAVAKHSNERISQQILMQSGGQALNAYLEVSSNKNANIISSLYGIGSNYGVLLPFSRKQEYEADKLGLIFMAMAGYNPETAVGFWQKMSSSGSGKTPEFLSTHPSDANRIAYIRGIMPEVKGYLK